MKTASHLSDQSILLALDGEMGSREATRMRAHLEACWSCRARREQIKQVITTVVEYQSHDELVDELLPRPPGRRVAFIQQLDRLIEDTSQPSFARVMFSGLWKMRWQIGLAASALTLVILVARLLERPPSVSASELLSRANASEQAQLSGVSRPVIYRKISIRSGNQTVTRTTYRDPASRRVVDRMDPPNPLFLEAAFTRAGFDWQEPLSAMDYSAWRARLARKTDEVHSTAHDSLVLSTSASDGPVQEARLTVRASDWHPIAERLVLYDSRELEMTELDYRVLSLDSIGPGIFEPAVLPVPVTSRVESPSAPEIFPEPVKGPDPVELSEAELQALVALHNAKADVGEDIAVVRSNTGVVVQGVVESPGRKQELIAALGKLPYIQTQVTTLSEAALSQAQRLPAVSSSQPPITDSVLGPPLLQQTLEKQFPNVEDRSGFIDQALDMAQNALAHASALRHLGIRYAPPGVEELSLDSRRQLVDLLMDHSHLLRQELLTERALISAVAPPAESAPALALTAGTWQEAVTQILPDVRDLHSNVAALFGSSRTADPNARSTVAALRQTMAHLEALLSVLPERVNRELLPAAHSTSPAFNLSR